MERIQWKRKDINEIKKELELARGKLKNKAEKLSRRLGIDTQSLISKMKEIKKKKD